MWAHVCLSFPSEGGGASAEKHRGCGPWSLCRLVKGLLVRSIGLGDAIRWECRSSSDSPALAKALAKLAADVYSQCGPAAVGRWVSALLLQGRVKLAIARAADLGMARRELWELFEAHPFPELGYALGRSAALGGLEAPPVTLPADALSICAGDSQPGADSLRDLVVRGLVDGVLKAATAEVVEEQEAVRAALRAQRQRQEETSAVKIQSQIRGHQERQRHKQRKKSKAEGDAAVKIQAHVRGHAARKRHRALRQRKTEEESATKIQAQVRGHLSRKKHHGKGRRRHRQRYDKVDEHRCELAEQAGLERLDLEVLEGISLANADGGNFLSNGDAPPADVLSDIRPRWLREGREGPKGRRRMDGYYAAVYTEEQQVRLGTDELGNVWPGDADKKDTIEAE